MEVVFCRPVEGCAQAFDNLCFAGGGRTGDGKQDRGSATAISFITLSMKSWSTSALASLKAL